MIDELYINGTQIDINDIDIPRRYVSPYFRNVTEWFNNSTYTVTLPFTATNVDFFEHCMTADAASVKPYSLMLATYYCEGDLVFKDAETKLLGIGVDGFEVQFVWGVNRNKYLPFFDTKLNEIRTNGSTITESDWIVNWRKDNVVYATGKKFLYLDYVSGIRESDVFITGGNVKSQVQPPSPFNENLKEMTMHPFIPFNNIIDLACATVSQEITGVVETIIDQGALQLLSGFLDVRQGDILKSVDDSGDISGLNIRVSAVVGEIVYFNADISEYYDGETPIVFIRSSIASSEFADLKARLTNKGLILGGNKGNKTFTKTKTYAVDTPLAATDILPLDGYVGSFYILAATDSFGIGEYVIGNDKSVLKITLDITTFNDSGVDTVISLYKSIGGVETKITDFPYTSGGATTTYNCKFEIQPEYGATYLIRTSNTNTVTILADSSVEISQNVQTALYSMVDEIDAAGYYDCLLNLPEITVAEFIQQMLIMTGLFIGFDNDGNIQFLSLDDFEDNLDSGNVIDWSNKVHDILGTQFNFMDLAQSNLITYANADDTEYDSKGRINVNNFTLDKEQELYNLIFDLPLTGRDRAEIIMYKQRIESSDIDGVEQVSFKNEYQQTNNVVVYDNSGIATYLNVVPNDILSKGLVFNGFISQYYQVFMSLVNRAFVQEIEVNLNVYEQNRFDFTKPVYIDWLGRYCLVLEILGMRDEVSTAKVLIVKNI